VLPVDGFIAIAVPPLGCRFLRAIWLGFIWVWLSAIWPKQMGTAVQRVDCSPRMAVFRCGLNVFERTYSHDYGTIYAKEAKTRSPLNAHLTGVVQLL
jgi:hypothetical protein